MLQRSDKSRTSAQVGGAFPRLGRIVVHHPLLVIAAWLALTAALSLTLPSLQQMVRERPVDLLPQSAPVMETSRQMTEAFHESASQNVMLVILTDERGLGPDDDAVYRRLVQTLRHNSNDVTTVQDFDTTPPLREVLASKDGNAWYIPVGLAGDLGTPKGYDAYTRVAADVKAVTAGSGLTVNLTGPAATVADLTDVGERDLHVIEIATALMVLTILLVVYRNPVTMMLPLITIGVSLTVAQDLVAGLSRLGLGVSNQTITFMTALMVGAGVDYAVFLISRYHEYVRAGESSDDAIVHALSSIGKVIAASAATVAVTFLGMSFTKLGLFSTIGPALALSIGVAFLAAVTLLPAILALAGRRKLVRPRRDLTTRFWRRTGIHIVRRPKAHLLVSLVVLIGLASCAGFLRYNYDDRKTLPAATESNLGYAAMDRHFALNSTIPQYLYISSPQDLRSPRALADLEQMAQRVSQVPGVAMVRGITRPTGGPLEEAKATYQAGAVGDKLKDASGQIHDKSDDLDRLTTGANTMADNLGTLRSTVSTALGPLRVLVEALSAMTNQFGDGKTLDQIDSAAGLVTNMRALGDALESSLGHATEAYTWAAPMVTALDASEVCDADPACVSSRADTHRLVAAYQGGRFAGMADVARQLKAADGTATIGATTAAMRGALARATTSLRELGLDTPGGVDAQFGQVQQGVDQLADASRQLADGVAVLVDQTRQMGAGLSDASTFLLAMRHEASDQSMAGFFIPPQIMGQTEFKDAAAAFISPDGHSARYLVQTELNPFSTDAMDQSDAIVDAARSAQPNTSLAGAQISVSGFTATLRDIRDYYESDIGFIIVMTILVVLLILTVLLRAIVAPLYLIGSVIVSYLSALGIGVIAFQFIGGQELSWSVPGMAFIVLVAVGADYNLLLISRIRDESPHGVRSGVIRTVGSTGGVITSAGVIFAASMFGLLFGGIATMVQAGFVIGVGLLLDTFIVRTITVPAIAVLFGEANWWPAPQLSRRFARRRAARLARKERRRAARPAHVARGPAPLPRIREFAAASTS